MMRPPQGGRKAALKDSPDLKHRYVEARAVVLSEGGGRPRLSAATVAQ